MEHGAAGGSDGRKLPFYMTFPFSENLSAESENERDMQLSLIHISRTYHLQVKKSTINTYFEEEFL